MLQVLTTLNQRKGLTNHIVLVDFDEQMILNFLQTTVKWALFARRLKDKSERLRLLMKREHYK